MASPSCIPQLEALTVTAGTAGQLWPGLVRQDTGGYGIMGRPCIISEKLPALGDEGDIMLVDWKQYAIGMRQEISVEASRHVYFTSDEVAWRAIMRFDGMPKWSSTYTDINGSTYSWCVTLAAR
jgi:HK97 family phage major capsid protein